MLTAAVNAERSSTNGDTAKFYAFPKFAASYNLPFDRVRHRQRQVPRRERSGRQPRSGQLQYTFLTRCRRTASSVFVRRRRSDCPNVTAGSDAARPKAAWTSSSCTAARRPKFTFYKKTTIGLVLQASPPPSSGFTTQIINGGSLTNSGAGNRPQHPADPEQLPHLAVAHDVLAQPRTRHVAAGAGVLHGLDLLRAVRPHEGPGRLRPGRSRGVQRLRCRRLRGTSSSPARRARTSRWASPTTSRTARSVSRRWSIGGTADTWPT